MRSGRLAETIKSLRGKDRDVHALVVLRNTQEAYPALVRAVVSAVQSNGPINQSTSDANKLAQQLRLPFSGKPGNPLSPSGQDVPQPPK
jgi:hypothetical protein